MRIHPTDLDQERNGEGGVRELLDSDSAEVRDEDGGVLGLGEEVVETCAGARGEWGAGRANGGGACSDEVTEAGSGRGGVYGQEGEGAEGGGG